ncbi:MAG: hypothetical protein WDZ59_06940 [Pirellulales bacterium]
MHNLFLLAIGSDPANLWYALPLIVVITLVYCATRHEDIVPILKHALHFGTTLILFLAVGLVILTAMAWFT